MTCADLDILLAEYVDGAIHGMPKLAIENHLALCSACAELARDAAAAVAFMERTADIEAPPELVARLVAEISSGPSRTFAKRGWLRRIFGSALGARLEPVLQPRLTMGVATAALSVGMLGQLTGLQVRPSAFSDLNPAKLWNAAEDRAERSWERTIKYCDNLRPVFEIRTELAEWTAPEDGRQDAVETDRPNPDDFRGDGPGQR
jgi:predicted anti-sigma-YlaC factor YlaD